MLSQGSIAEAAEALRIAGQGDDELSVHAVGLLGDALWQLGDLQGAELAYSNVVASADADLAARASFALSGVRRERGDARGAADALRSVMQSSNPLAAKAGVELGTLLRELGDRAGARQAWKEAAQTGHPEYAPTAANMLGLDLESDGDYEGAVRAFTQALDAIPPDDNIVLPKVALRLALLLRDHREYYPRILRDASERVAEYAVYASFRHPGKH